MPITDKIGSLDKELRLKSITNHTNFVDVHQSNQRFSSLDTNRPSEIQTNLPPQTMLPRASLPQA